MILSLRTDTIFMLLARRTKANGSQGLTAVNGPVQLGREAPLVHGSEPKCLLHQPLIKAFCGNFRENSTTCHGPEWVCTKFNVFNFSGMKNYQMCIRHGTLMFKVSRNYITY